MEQFSVKLGELNYRIDEEDYIRKRLAVLESDIWSVSSSLSFKIGCQQNIASNLRSLARAVGNCQDQTRNMKKALGSIRREYQKAENTVSGKRIVVGITWDDIFNAFKKAGVGIAFSALSPVSGISWLYGNILAGGEDETSFKYGASKFKLVNGERKNNDLFKNNQSYSRKLEYEVSENGLKKTKDNKVIVDKDHPSEKKESTDEEKKKKILDSITLIEGKYTKEGSLLHGGVSEELENGSYSANVDVMKASFDASGKITARGAKAAVGAAFTAFSADAAGKLGSKYNNVHASGNVSAGKAEAKASVGVGVTDKGLELGASASVEAIAAEVSGKAGLSLAGTDVNVGGTLNFGAGAHFKAGLENGKLSLDIGASLGVGGSVNLEIDMSNTIEAVGDVANGVCEAATDFYDGATDFCEDAADAIGDVASDIGDSIKRGWKKLF